MKNRFWKFLTLLVKWRKWQLYTFHILQENLKEEGLKVYKLIASNGKVDYGVNEYICDSINDLNSLPPRCESGSTAIVLEDGDIAVYMKNTEGKWVKL